MRIQRKSSINIKYVEKLRSFIFILNRIGKKDACLNLYLEFVEDLLDVSYVQKQVLFLFGKEIGWELLRGAIKKTKTYLSRYSFSRIGYYKNNTQLLYNRDS